MKGFREIKKDLNIVGAVRAIGLLGAIELVRDPEINERFTPELRVAPRVIDALHERGVICRSVTYDGTDIICFAPPLIITKSQINSLISKVHDAVAFVQKQL